MHCMTRMLLPWLALFSLAGCSASAWTAARSPRAGIGKQNAFGWSTTALPAAAPAWKSSAPYAEGPPSSPASPRRRRRFRQFAAGAQGLRLAARPLSVAASVRGGGEVVRWTAPAIAKALAIFVGCGIAEIGGGWLVWQAVREGKPWWWALAGSVSLVLYGFLPTLQSSTESFARIYAAYGGFFIFLSYLWGMIFDGMRPDKGDVLGGSLALVAVSIILFWPRNT